MSRARDLASSGVTSTVLSAKAPLASPDFTGTVDLTGTTISLDNDQISGDKVSGGTIGAGTFNGTIGSSATFPAGSIVGSNFHVLTTRHAISNSNNTGSAYDTLAGWSWLQLELSYTLKTDSPVLHLSCHVCMSTTNHGERLSLKVHRVDSSGNSVAPVSGFVTSQESSRRHGHASDLYFSAGSDEHLMNFAFNTQDDLSLSAGTTVYYRVYGNQNASGITFYMNRPDNDSNYYYIPSTVSSFSLMEIVE